MSSGLAIQEMDGGVRSIPELVVTASDPLPGRESPVKEVVPPSPTKQPVFLKSNLHKKGKRLKGWHQRYFEIQGRHMYYYKNHTKADCLGEIDLSLCIHCDVSDEATFGAPFEIRTTVRTHVMSARSDAERDQWIQGIKAQMGTESEKKPTTNKPKRWKTFRNAFKIPQRPPRASAASSKVTKKKSIMDRFRLKRSNAPAPLQIRKELNEEPPIHDRPLSLNDDDIPRDTLAALQDVVPSRSLPATPLVRKRLENLSPSESPVYTDSETPLTPYSPTNVVIVPVEVTPASEVHHDSERLFSDLEKFQERQFIWDQIRENLESDETPTVSYDMLPEEDQEWMNHSSGLEQLRAFLAVCD